MIRHYERYAVVAMHRAAEFANRELRFEQRLCGERAERDDDLWTNDLELAHQIRAAGFDFHLVKPVDPDDLRRTLASVTVGA